MNGAIEAASEQEAIQQLNGRGMTNVSMVTGQGSQVINSPKQASRVPTSPFNAVGQKSGVISGDPFAQKVQPSSQPVKRLQTGPGGMSINAPQAIVRPVHYTKRGSNVVLRFLFTQLASYFQSGVNPAHAFSQLAAQTSQIHYQESLADAARLTAEGIPFSAVMEMYPDLYPASAVGMIRAGEAGGYLPEACKEVANIASQARKMNIWGLVTYINIFGNLLLLWPVWLMANSIAGMWNNAEAHPYQSGGTDFKQWLFPHLLWPFGPIILLTGFICWYLPKWWLRRDNTEARHARAIRTWPLRHRAVAESMQVFSWNLAMTSQAGLPPTKAFELAAGCVPNLFLSHQLSEVRAVSPESTKLSDLIAQVPFAAQEMAGMAQTAEMTGQMTEMMMQASTMQGEQFQLQNTYANLELIFVLLTVLVVAAGIGAILLALGYTSIIHSLLQGT